MGQQVNEHNKLKPLGLGTMKLKVKKKYSYFYLTRNQVI